MGIREWLEADVKRDLDKLDREEEMLGRLTPQEYVSYFIGVNTKAVLTELRIIKLVLIAILFMLVIFAHHLLPSGWWKSW